MKRDRGQDLYFQYGVDNTQVNVNDFETRKDIYVGNMRFLSKLGDDEIIKLALACDLLEKFPSTEMEQNGMRVLRFDRLITVISKNEGKTGQASYEFSTPFFNDHETLKSDLANKGTKITLKQNEELVKFMTQKFDKQYVYWCNRYWYQKEVIRHAENELEMM